jgi:AP endonuclease-2
MPSFLSLFESQDTQARQCTRETLLSNPLACSQRILRDEELQRTEDDGESWEEPDYKDLDSEGRALVLDVGLFVLIERN